MALWTRAALLSWVLLLPLSSSASAEEPPVIPIGLDAYRQWERWPYQRIGARAYLRSTYDRTGYYIYHQYVRGAKLSRPLHAWDARTPPDTDVLQLIARAGTDLAPRPGSPEGTRVGVKEKSGKITLPANESVTLVEITE